MPTDAQMLNDFVLLGQEILSCDWAAHYGHDIARVAPSPPGVGYAQPGFLGRDYRGLVFIGQNPGVGALRAEAHRNWERAFRRWDEERTVAAYEDVFAFWRNDLSEWPAWTKFVKPILDQLGFTEDSIGYLNLCKNALTDNKSPTARMYQNDWDWTQRQLALLRPRVVVAGGVEVGRKLATYWPAPDCVVLDQDRIRSQNRAALDRQTYELAAKIRLALQ